MLDLKVDLQSNNICPIKTQIQTETQEACHVMTEEEFAVRHLQAKECQGFPATPEARSGAWKGFPFTASGRY